MQLAIRSCNPNLSGESNGMTLTMINAAKPAGRKLLAVLMLIGMPVLLCHGQIDGAVESTCTVPKALAREFVEALNLNVTAPTEKTLTDFGKYFAPTFKLRDPITKTDGWPAYREVLEQFVTAKRIHFEIIDWSCSKRTIYVTWLFGMTSDPASKAVAFTPTYTEVEGISRFTLGDDDLIVEDTEYWATVPASWRDVLR